MDKIKVFAVYPVGTNKQATIDTLRSQGYSVLDIDHTKFSYMYDSSGNIEIGITNKNGGTPYKKKNYKFPQNYVDFVCANLNSYDVIMVSTNKDVLKALVNKGIMFKTVVPDLSMDKEKIVTAITNSRKSSNWSWSYIKDQIENYKKYIIDVTENANPDVDNIVLSGEDPDALELYHIIINK